MICYKFNNTLKKGKKPELKADQAETKDEIVSTMSHTEKNKVFLRTCSVKVKNEKKERISWLLLDCGFMRSFLCQKIDDKLNLNVMRKEKMSVFTLGNKTPIEKLYNVAKVTLENKDNPEYKIQIEALE